MHIYICISVISSSECNVRLNFVDIFKKKNDNLVCDIMSTESLKYIKTMNCYEHLSKVICDVLNDVGVCVIDNYIRNKCVADLVVSEVKQLYATPDLFYKADEHLRCDQKNNESFRSDYVYWLNDKETTSISHCSKLEKSFEVLMASCVKMKLIPRLSHKSRFQVSCFPEKSFGYKKHTDNSNNNGRLLTIVYYCNASYDRATSGGLHRFHVYDNNISKKVIDVEPKFNRAVIYWSDTRIVNETLHCQQDLFSLTSWYFSSLTESTFT